MNPANTSEQSPLFRTDLVAQPVFAGGQVFVDVTDPDSRKTFRFYDFEYSIACAMDGCRDVNGLISWATDELGLSPTPAELASVIATLGDLGYLSEGAAGNVVSAHDRPTPAPTPIAAPAVGAAVDLGLAGPTSAAASTPPGSTPSSDVELGRPGRSPIAPPRPTPPKADDVELGFSGVGDAAPVEDARHVPSAEIEIAPLGGTSATSPPNPSAPETSFAGLMEEDESDRAPTQSIAPLTVDDEDIDVANLSPPPTDLPAAEPKPTLRPVTNQGGAGPELDEDTHLPPPQVEYDDEDVSVDLSAHLSVGTAELKEAVRQSKVMQAVDVPADLLAELGDDEEPTTTVKAAPASEAPASAAAAVAAADVAEEAVGATPIELPDATPKAKKPATAEPEKATAKEPVEAKQPKKTSTGLIVLFVIVLLGAAFAYWWFNMRQEDKPARSRPSHRVVKPTSGTRPTNGTRPATNGTKPPVKPAITFKLEAKPGPATIVNNAEGGNPEFAVADGAKVAPGDLLAKVGPWKRGESRIKDANGRIEHYSKKIERLKKQAAEAKDAGNAAAQKAFERRAKQMKAEKIDARRKNVIEKWEKRIFAKAPVAGTVKLLAEKGKWLEAGKPLLKIEAAPATGGSFAAPAGKTFAAGDQVSVSRQSDASKKASCKVTAVESSKVSVDCSGTPFAAGDELVVHLD